MNDVIITVRGEHESRIAPERATAHLSVRAEGPERTEVVERALSLADPVRGSLTARADEGALADWTSARLSVRSDRPWNNEGKRLAPVFSASVDFTATFADASELSLWASEVSAWDGVELGGVDWSLTPETRARLEQEVASDAVRVAVTRAETYAGALGLATVVPLEIADTGLISQQHPAAAPQLRGIPGAMFASTDVGSSMSYEPGDITISTTVEARFRAI